MKTLKAIFKENKKEISYQFYQRVILKPLAYSKITRDQIYHEIITSYINDPEIILRLCNIEEINILKNLLDENIPVKNEGYIEYLLLSELQNNYLIWQDDNYYYIPEDLINPIKMAINLYNEEEYSLKDITDSVILGLVRLHNVIELDTFITYLKEYNIIFDKENLKKYLLNDVRNKDKLAIIKYQQTDYLTSLEYPYYKDILKLRNTIEVDHPILEEVISIGKYKIDLFQEKIFKFLNFLELHLEPKYVDSILEDIIIYTGFRINDLTVLKKISGEIDSLFKALQEVEPYLPVWVFNGRTLNSFKNLK